MILLYIYLIGFVGFLLFLIVNCALFQLEIRRRGELHVPRKFRWSTIIILSILWPAALTDLILFIINHKNKHQ